MNRRAFLITLASSALTGFVFYWSFQFASEQFADRLFEAQKDKSIGNALINLYFGSLAIYPILILLVATSGLLYSFVVRKINQRIGTRAVAIVSSIILSSLGVFLLSYYPGNIDLTTVFVGYTATYGLVHLLVSQLTKTQ